MHIREKASERERERKKKCVYIYTFNHIFFCVDAFVCVGLSMQIYNIITKVHRSAG